MSILTWITGKKLEREIKKATEAILLEEKHENFFVAVRKSENMLVAPKAKMSGSEKPK